MMTFLQELKRLAKSRMAKVVPVSGSVIADPVTFTMRHDVCVADALQVDSCRTVVGARLVTADRPLAVIAGEEGLEVTVVA